jgi:hypothetical protein
MDRLDGLPCQKTATLGGLDPLERLKLCHCCFVFIGIAAQFLLLYLCVTTALMLRAVGALGEYRYHIVAFCRPSKRYRRIYLRCRHRKRSRERWQSPKPPASISRNMYKSYVGSYWNCMEPFLFHLISFCFSMCRCFKPNDWTAGIVVWAAKPASNVMILFYLFW